MGWSANQTRRTSLWDYDFAVSGWRKAHEPPDKTEEDNMTPAKFREIMARPVQYAVQ